MFFLRLLQKILQALFKSLPMLLDVLLLTLFYFAIFGIICVQLFMGILRKQCGAPDFSNAVTVIDNATGIVTLTVSSSGGCPH